MAWRDKNRHLDGPITVDMYVEMIARGNLTEADRVELIEGEIVEMSPIGRPHWATVTYLTMYFAPRAEGRYLVGTGSPVTIQPHSVPEPDITLMVPRADFYQGKDLTPEDILLLVEVSDSSLAIDNGRKKRLYASCGIPEYWVIDLPGRRVLSFRQPVGAEWRIESECREGDSLTPSRLPGLSFPAGDMLRILEG